MAFSLFVYSFKDHDSISLQFPVPSSHLPATTWEGSLYSLSATDGQSSEA